jgi:hypothetical protein
MSWVKDVFTTWQMNTGDQMGRVDNQTANVANQSQMRIQDPRTSGTFHTGRVLDSCAGAYYSIVRIKGGPDLPCIKIGSMNSIIMGANESALPAEGTQVLVHKPHHAADFGIIIGCVPSADFTRHGSDGTPAWSYTGLWDVEPSASGSTELAYDSAITDNTDVRVVEANATRVADAFPGDWAQINDRDVGFTLGRFMASMKGSDRARVDVSLVDDHVRIISGYFRHIHCQGEIFQCNDGGYPSSWASYTSHQCEKSGYKDYGPPVVVDTGNKKHLPTSNASRYKLIKPDLMAKRRMHVIHGWLGDMLDLFVAKPDPDNNPLQYQHDSKDQGLFHAHVDSCGRMVVRSAMGISLQRWDRIPVPKQKYELWDPEGDKIEVDYEPKEKKPVDWPSDDPYGRNVQLRDGYAWIHKMGYRRLHDQSVQAGMKDIYLPEENELRTPDQEYDELGKAEEEYKEYANRQSYVNIEDDGSIILKDTWGSEIVMRGGNIIFTCPGQIEVRPGKSLVMLAGDDLIGKAKNSVDITATDKDVRIKAEGNLHLLAEGREGKGGVLIESRADGEGVAFEGLEGENVMSRGIILKAKDSSIFSQARSVHSSAEKYHKIECWGKDEGNDGMILLSGRKLLSNMKQQTLFTTNTTTALVLGRGSAALVGRSAILWGGRSVAVGKDSKAWIPLMQVPIPIDVYASFQSFIELIHDFLQDTPWLSPFLPSMRDEIEFTYRTSQQYNTMQATEVEGATAFRVYEGSWAYLKDTGWHMLRGLAKSTWTEYPISGTWPWPGEKHYGGGDAYRKLSTEVNIEDLSKGIPKIREDVEAAVSTFFGVDFNQYEVVL